MKSKSLLPVAIAVILQFLQTDVFSQSPLPPPAAYPAGTQVSYVRTWDATAPESNPNNLMTRPLKDVKQTTQYVDGLGRPIETVAMKGSLETATGTNADMVNANVYDPYGREVTKYLPFAANNTGGNASITDGLFKLNPFQEQAAFYGDVNGVLKNQGETFYYSQNVFEPSPLNRVTETFAAGNNWSGTSWDANINNHHSVKINYWANTATDNVRVWKVTDVANGWGTYAITYTAYPPGTLFKNVTVDEKNNQVEEFKDNEGKLILKKVQLTATTDTGLGSGYPGWLCTYYIYDDFNRLRCVIQPYGVQLISANGILTDPTILAEQCFRYEYDIRNRMIRKKVPGAAEVDMVYDSRDRLVMVQDGNMLAAGKWLVTKYDNINRPIETGLLTDATTPFTTHLSNAYNSTSYPSTTTGYEQLTVTHYDNYTSLPSGLSSSFLTTWNGYFSATNNTTWPYPQMPTASSATTGAVTWTQTKILGSSPAQFISTASIYDDKGRVVQGQSINITGGLNAATTQYNWKGQPLVTVMAEIKTGFNTQTSTMVSQLTYDDLGRVVKTEKKIANTLVNSGTMPSTFKTTAQLQYDKLGQLKTKTLSPTGGSGGSPIETLNYDYNIRGWLLGMNRDYAKDTLSTTNWFGFDLGYDKTSFTVNGSAKNYTAAQYNGNIGGMLWKSTGDDQVRKYDFTYDAVNRLTSAGFTQLTNSVFNVGAGIDFSVNNMNYDANGNILTMNQKGFKIGGSVTIDSLLYSYITNTNKLLNVLDRANDTATKLGDFRSSKAYMTSLGNNKTTAATDYTYDVNGNMYVDKNKDIGNIHYNYLNLPDSITVTSKGNIKYVYDAAGNKLKKITTEGAKVTTTLYLLGNFINDTLQFLPQEEGRVRFKTTDNSLQYDYFLKDHLGNVRMVLTEEQQTDAYPVASLEAATLGNEKIYYSGLDTGRVNKNTVPGYPTDIYTNPNDYIQKLGTNGFKVGAGIVLKVMAGDQFNLRVNSWWNSIATPGSPVSPVTSLLAALNTGIGTLAGVHGSIADLSSSSILSVPITDFITSHSGYTTSKPKAFINWVLFDEQFKFVSSSSGFEQVGSSNVFTTHTRNNLSLTKSGYLYVYVSNETPNIDVFFDNLQVTQVRGPLLEETHYYPFGLTMAGISSQAAGKLENKMKFQKQELQHKEFSDGSGLEMYEFKYRMDDPQIGRFIQIDPLSDSFKYNSTYAFSEDKVINGVELEGREWENFMSKFKNPEDLKVQLPGKSAEVQTYQVTSQNASMSIEDFKKTDITKVLSNSKATFNEPVDGKGNATDMKAGAFIKIDINGPLNDGYVKVSSITESKNSISYTFNTLEGHVEKGIIIFTASSDTKGNLTFNINSTSEINNGTAKSVLNDFTRNQQIDSWKEVLTNFVNTTGGTEANTQVTRFIPGTFQYGGGSGAGGGADSNW